MFQVDRRFITVAALFCVAAAGACNSTSSPGTRAVSFSLSGARTPTTPTVRAAAMASAMAGDTIALSKAQAVLAEIELERSSSTCAAAQSGPQGDCDGLELAPMIFDIPLAPGVQTKFTTGVHEGTFIGFEAHVDAVNETHKENGVATFLAAHPEFKGVSVWVEGNYTYTPAGGTKTTVPFVYKTDLDAEIEMSFNPPLTVTKDGINITLTINLNSWFRDASGGFVDPRDPANKALIDANIRRSFKAFEDDNKQG